MEATGSMTGAGAAEVRWRAIVAEQRGSGTTVRAPCVAPDLACSLLFGWRRRRATAASSSAMPPTRVRILTTAGTFSCEPASPSGPFQLELRGDDLRGLIRSAAGAA
jgi:hypothetical protein